MLCNGNVRKRLCFVMLDIQCIYWCFLLFQNPFHPSGPFKSIKTMLKSLHVLLGLSPDGIAIQKSGHMKGTT